jgi:triacylglycerol esterase/lipase EstA (alpha/beta hydrolase family)
MLYGDFSMNSDSVDNVEAMKQGNEALNASSLQYFRSVKHFIATNFTHQLMLHGHSFFKEDHRLMLHRHFFLK